MEFHNTETRGTRILCLDGGGIRGLLEIEMLSILSQVVFKDPTGAKFVEGFDLICGTSTGGILALALSKGIDLTQCHELYERLGTQLFGGSVGYFGGRAARWIWDGDYYSSKYMGQLVGEYFGDGNLSDIAKKVFVISTDSTSEEWNPFLFRSYENPTPKFPGSSEATLLETVRATSAAPTYFKPQIIGDKTFVDGGVTANNPSELAIFEAKSLWPDRPIECIVSMGTGRLKQAPGSQNLVKLLGELIDICSDSHHVHQKVKNWIELTMESTKYYRFDPNHGEGSIPLDESNPKIWSMMMTTTAQYMTTKADKIEDLKKLLNPDECEPTEDMQFFEDLKDLLPDGSTNFTCM